MSALAICITVVGAGMTGFGIGYIFGRDHGHECGRDAQWMDDFFLSLNAYKQREQTRPKQKKR